MTTSLSAHSGGRLDAGYTLVELLVSMTIFAFILVLVPDVLRMGHRALTTAAQVTEGSDTGVALTFVTQRLQQALPVYDRDADGLATLAFSGERHSLSFVASSPAGPFGSGLYRFKISTAPHRTAGGRTLLLAMTVYRSTEPRLSKPTEARVLMRGKAFHFRYFGASVRKGDPAWSSDWTSMDRLPDMVEITALTFEPADFGRVVLRLELKLRRPA